jgi:hypothetical protein
VAPRSWRLRYQSASPISFLGRKLCSPVQWPGAGATWFEIDQLGFDQQFLSVLSLIASCLTLIGMVLLRPLMATRSIAFIVVGLTIVAAALALPNIGLYYGVQEWTGRMTGGLVDERFIAIIDTTLESPLGQIAMIPRC